MWVIEILLTYTFLLQSRRRRKWEKYFSYVYHGGPLGVLFCCKIHSRRLSLGSIFPVAHALGCSGCNVFTPRTSSCLCNDNHPNCFVEMSDFCWEDQKCPTLMFHFSMVFMMDWCLMSINILRLVPVRVVRVWMAFWVSRHNAIRSFVGILVSVSNLCISFTFWNVWYRDIYSDFAVWISTRVCFVNLKPMDWYL